ncbi:MAG: DotU/TssL family secretion system protein [Gammaproteobacteria bacterium]
MSNNNDNDGPKAPPRTRVRRVERSEGLQSPGRANKSSEPKQFTKVRRVERKDHGADRRQMSDQGRRYSERADADQEHASDEYRRQGPEQVRTPSRQREPARRRDTVLPDAHDTDAYNRPLLDEASSLLALGGYLRNSDRPKDLEQLRAEIIEAVHRYSNSISDSYGARTVEDASFCVCAFLDDCVLGSLWSKGSSWAQSSVLAKVHRRADRSDLVSMIRRNLDGGIDPDLAALYHTVLSLGFSGSEDQAGEIEKLREQMYRELKKLGHEEQRHLVSDAMIVADRGEYLAARLPWWTLLAGSAVIMLGIYLGFWYLQKTDVSNFHATVEQRVIDHTRLQLSDFVPEAYVPPTPQRINLRALLADDIAKERLRLLDGQPGTRIVISSDGMFSSGSAVMVGNYHRLIRRIGTALGETTGQIIVEGHTDNVPFRGGLRTNQSLSKDRAVAVGSILTNALEGDSRLVVIGRADRAPLECNDSSTSRAVNRRVELVLPEIETDNVPDSAPPTCGGQR